jgi:hypothetical protein
MAALVPPQPRSQQPAQSQPGVDQVVSAFRADASSAVGNDGVPSAVGYRATPWEMVELMPGLALMVSQNRGEFVRRVASEIWQRYGSAAR